MKQGTLALPDMSLDVSTMTNSKYKLEKNYDDLLDQLIEEESMQSTYNSQTSHISS